MRGSDARCRVRQPAFARLILAYILISLCVARAGYADIWLPQDEVRAGTIRFVYWPGQQAAAAALAQRLEVPPRLLSLPDDVLADAQLVVFLAPDRETFDSLAPGVPDWSGGIAFPQGDRIVLPTFSARTGRTPMATVLRHELAHIALDRYLGTRVPRWFHEGYAQLAAGSWRPNDAWGLRVAILLGRTPALESISLDFARGRLGADHAYLLSYTAVEFLYRLGGGDGFARLLERWRETGDLDMAMRRTYGITLGQFERLWRRDVGRRFGWLLVVAQTAVFWTILTVLLLVLGYWKRIRTRQKLVALEAAVSAAEASNLIEEGIFEELESPGEAEIDENQGKG